MTVRRFAQAAFISLTLVGISFNSKPLFAQDAPQPDVENSKFQITGMINSTAFVRSAPSDTSYPTSKLEKGSEVTVVGERFNWLKIVPPEGSFCYVAKAYVNRAGNGSIGVVSSTLNVRIGSNLNTLKTQVAAKLDPNDQVTIVGEQDEYFKIKPPTGVFLYIDKQFVDPLHPAANNGAADAGQQPVPTPQNDNSTQQQQPQNINLAQGGATTEPSTQPTQQSARNNDNDNNNNPPATQPTAEAQDQFDKLENTYSEVSQKPLDQQPVEELLAGYQKLNTDDSLPESMKRICDFKINVLKTRVDLKSQYAEAKKMQEDMNAKQQALKSEQQELQQRVKDNTVVFYTAVGTLRTSSLQQGQQTLYRLTDPASGRTVIYLRSDDNKLAQMLGQFIGVRGEVNSDSQLNLRTVTPTAVEQVDPAKVGTSVAAQIVPASLLPGGATASGAGQ